MFVDEARIIVRSGKGGDGAVSFHKEKYKPRGKPDGGDGGRGGSVILQASHSVASLSYLRDHPHQRAASGSRGAKNNQTGASAEDSIIEVPVGTVVKTSDGKVLADLAAPGDKVVVARGGRAGRGNAAFLSHKRRAPGFAELGEPGIERELMLELRLIADVAVVGMPNAGKSTLVSAVSAARPKIADYAFTTLEPSLGVVEHGEHRFIICDVPGLIEGASEGKGLGHRFLRHVSRAPVFIHLLDLASERDPVEDHRVIRTELKRYDPELAERPEVIALNKIDAVSQQQVHGAQSQLASEGETVVAISAATRQGLDELLDAVGSLVAIARTEVLSEGFVLYEDEMTRPTEVKRESGGWRVTGDRIERWVAMTDMSNPEAVSYLQDRMEKAGVEQLLKDAGAQPGDDVFIGNSAFEWWPLGAEPPEERGRD